MAKYKLTTEASSSFSSLAPDRAATCSKTRNKRQLLHTYIGDRLWLGDDARETSEGHYHVKIVLSQEWATGKIPLLFNGRAQGLIVASISDCLQCTCKQAERQSRAAMNAERRPMGPYMPLPLREHFRCRRLRLAHHDIRAFATSVSHVCN